MCTLPHENIANVVNWEASVVLEYCTIIAWDGVLLTQGTNTHILAHEHAHIHPHIHIRAECYAGHTQCIIMEIPQHRSNETSHCAWEWFQWLRVIQQTRSLAKVQEKKQKQLADGLTWLARICTGCVVILKLQPVDDIVRHLAAQAEDQQLGLGNSCGRIGPCVHSIAPAAYTRKLGTRLESHYPRMNTIHIYTGYRHIWLQDKSLYQIRLKCLMRSHSPNLGLYYTFAEMKYAWTLTGPHTVASIMSLAHMPVT